MRCYLPYRMPRVVPSQVAAFIDQAFPAVKSQFLKHYAKEKQHSKEPISQFGITAALNSGEVAGLLELLDHVPGELLTIEGENFTRYVAAVASLRQLVGHAQSADPNLRRSPLTTSTGSGDLNPVTVVLQAMSRCPDEMPSPATAALSFITDRAFRETLRLDISAVDRALANGEWKATTVLAGSVIEALLLWALQQPTHASKVDASKAGGKLLKRAQGFGCTAKTPSGALEYGELAPFLDIAGEIGSVIKPDTLGQAQLARNFRNLIHPGRVERLQEVCDRGTALAAVAALEHVVRDVTPP